MQRLNDSNETDNENDATVTLRIEMPCSKHCSPTSKHDDEDHGDCSRYLFGLTYNERNNHIEYLYDMYGYPQECTLVKNLRADNTACLDLCRYVCFAQGAANAVIYARTVLQDTIRATHALGTLNFDAFQSGDRKQVKATFEIIEAHIETAQTTLARCKETAAAAKAAALAWVRHVSPQVARARFLASKRDEFELAATTEEEKIAHVKDKRRRLNQLMDHLQFKCDQQKSNAELCDCEEKELGSIKQHCLSLLALS